MGEPRADEPDPIAQTRSTRTGGQDRHPNRAHAPLISSRASAVTVRVIPANEERMIARHTFELLRSRQGSVMENSLHA